MNRLCTRCAQIVEAIHPHPTLLLPPPTTWLQNLLTSEHSHHGPTAQTRFSKPWKFFNTPLCTVVCICPFLPSAHPCETRSALSVVHLALMQGMMWSAAGPGRPILAALPPAFHWLSSVDQLQRYPPPHFVSQVQPTLKLQCLANDHHSVPLTTTPLTIASRTTRLRSIFIHIHIHLALPPSPLLSSTLSSQTFQHWNSSSTFNSLPLLTLTYLHSNNPFPGRESFQSSYLLPLSLTTSP